VNHVLKPLSRQDYFSGLLRSSGPALGDGGGLDARLQPDPVEVQVPPDDWIAAGAGQARLGEPIREKRPQRKSGPVMAWSPIPATCHHHSVDYCRGATVWRRHHTAVRSACTFDLSSVTRPRRGESQGCSGCMTGAGWLL